MMQPESPNHRDERVLIYAPTGRDAALTARFLVDAKLRPEACESVEHLCLEMSEGAGLLFLAGEALTPEALRCLTGALAEQPAWSDIPIVVLTSGGGGTPANAAALSPPGGAGTAAIADGPGRGASSTCARPPPPPRRSRGWPTRTATSSGTTGAGMNTRERRPRRWKAGAGSRFTTPKCSREFSNAGATRSIPASLSRWSFH